MELARVYDMLMGKFCYFLHIMWKQGKDHQTTALVRGAKGDCRKQAHDAEQF